MKLFNLLLFIFLLQNAFNVSLALGTNRHRVQDLPASGKTKRLSPEQEKALEVFLKRWQRETQAASVQEVLAPDSLNFLVEDSLHKMTRGAVSELAKPGKRGSWNQSGTPAKVLVKLGETAVTVHMTKYHFRGPKGEGLNATSPLLRIVKFWLATFFQTDTPVVHYIWCEKGVVPEVNFENFDWYVPFPKAYQFLTSTAWAAKEMKRLEEKHSMSEKSIITQTLLLCERLHPGDFSLSDLSDSLGVSSLCPHPMEL